MRISSQQIYQRGLQGMLNAHSSVAKTQQQIAKGSRVLTPADDPVAAVQIMRLDKDLAMSQQYKENIGIAENKLKLEETTLQSIEEIMQRLRDVSLQAGNPALSSDNRKAVAIEVRERLSQLVGLMNTRDSSGEYVFGGFQGGEKPFVARPGGGYEYQGDEGQRRVQISGNNSIAVSDSGKELFVDLPSESKTFSAAASSSNSKPHAAITSGRVMYPDQFASVYGEDYALTFNAESDVSPARANFTITRKSDGQAVTNPAMNNMLYTAGEPIRFNGIEFSINGSPKAGDKFFVDSSPNQNLLTTVERLADALETLSPSASGTNGPLENILGDTINNLDTAENRLLEVRAKVGARLNISEATLDQNEEAAIETTRLLSNVKDLDFAEAISRLEFQSFVLEAAQRSFSKVSSLSLFRFL